MKQGKIIKGIAGFYYVFVVGSGIYECKARGIFRKHNLKPLVGDDVMIEVLDEEKALGNLVEILPRKNALIRPASANVDQALIIFALEDPKPNGLLLDRFLITMAKAGVPTLVAFNKLDLEKGDEFRDICEQYADAGCEILGLCVRENRGVEELRKKLKGKVTVLAGPSGVGKSSLTNALQDEIHMETGEISRKLARGKNTTRHAQIIPIADDSFLMDTPGFTSFDLADMAKEELGQYYPEFTPFLCDCYFQGCAHINEPKCGVKTALKEGKVSPVRYRHYVSLYEELYEIEKRRYQ
ncbi:MAG: ribosome small subunit-dependent GTPase A [Lachnospiraceae bacterium]|nr:ribosome small subunit-dependent GTPase A [Lachnospiraceae bacterium]